MPIGIGIGIGTASENKIVKSIQSNNAIKQQPPKLNKGVLHYIFNAFNLSSDNGDSITLTITRQSVMKTNQSCHIKPIEEKMKFFEGVNKEKLNELLPPVQMIYLIIQMKTILFYAILFYAILFYAILIQLFRTYIKT